MCYTLRREDSFEASKPAMGGDPDRSGLRCTIVATSSVGRPVSTRTR